MASGTARVGPPGPKARAAQLQPMRRLMVANASGATCWRFTKRGRGGGPRPALLQAPLGDPRVVAGEQHLRPPPAPVLGRTGVVRILRSTLQGGAERLLQGRALVA